MRLGLSCGHGAKWRAGEMVKDPGAVHPQIGVTEYDSCRRMFNILYPMFTEHKQIALVTAPVEVPLQQRVEHLNLEHKHRKKIDLAIELHLNAIDRNDVDGTEVLYWPESDVGREWAEKLSEAISDAVDARNRGPKARDDLYFMRATAMPALIIESYFISNDKRAEDTLTSDLIHRAAWGIFQGIVGG